VLTRRGENPAYVLGHSDREISRLRRQAHLLEPATRQFLREAGIASGMRVLDVGSGAGDVAFLAAELVGACGEVVGNDIAAEAVIAATRRAKEKGMRNVSFLEGESARMEFDGPFDAVIGRYLLLFQSSPSQLLRKLARHVRPGGLMVFHEPDWTNAHSIPPAPIYDRCVGWIRDAFTTAGTDTNMAGKLYPAFVDAGLPAPTLRMLTFIGGGAACLAFLQAVADLVESLVPAMERQRVATADEVDAATLAERLRQEALANAGVIVGRSEVGAWARL
jgi:SAM-dependent methyltransferase